MFERSREAGPLDPYRCHSLYPCPASNIPNRSTFACPYCGARNLDQQELVKHCVESHRSDPNRVVSGARPERRLREGRPVGDSACPERRLRERRPVGDSARPERRPPREMLA